MPDGLEKIWAELEASRTPRATGWIRRLVNPGAPIPVHIAIKCGEPALSIMLDVPIAVTGGLRELPATTGLSVTLQAISGIPVDYRALIVELEDRNFSDLFSVFCTDLIERLSGCRKIPEAISLLLERLRRWQHFLSAAREGLSHPEIVGLFGELFVLQDLLIPLGGFAMIGAWTGAQRKSQDFVVPGLCALEVKTTEARNLQYVYINGEHQLDRTGFSNLALVCIRLDADSQLGESLPMQVERLRSLVAGVPEFRQLLERQLLNAGYFDRHAKRYEQYRFRVAEQKYFLIDTGFPCLVSSSLANGVDEVSYRLALKNCVDFERTPEEIRDVLNSLQLGRSQVS